MPYRAPRLCPCGYRVPHGVRCPCEQKKDSQRKARHDLRRPSSSARGYTSTWSKVRAEYLAQHPLCAFCGKPSEEVDHITPHKGDGTLFWDKANWRALCRSCHSGPAQREQRRRMKD